MSTDTMLPTYTITPKTVSLLDKMTLIDLLQHRTKLLLAATMARLPDRQYIDLLKSEVEILQEEIKRRKASQDPE